jgi:hypothetical protein
VTRAGPHSRLGSPLYPKSGHSSPLIAGSIAVDRKTFPLLSRRELAFPALEGVIYLNVQGDTIRGAAR